MLKVIGATSAETYRTQLEELGHVYVPNVYDPQLGQAIGPEIDELFRYTRLRNTNFGEQQRTSETVLPDDRQPNFMKVLGSIGVMTSDIFGKELWPPQPGTHALLLSIDMTPITASTICADGSAGDKSTKPVYGSWHQDRSDIKGLVAISTNIGESGLEIAGGAVHVLRPGGVIFLDNDKSVEHRGFSSAKRRAFGLANILPKRKSRVIKR